MELRQLRYFIAVADAGSISAAAKVLGVTQPTISIHIRKLEGRLATNLFERRAQGMSLTFAGNRLLRTARRVVKEIDEALARDGRVARAELGTLSIGFYTSLSGSPLRDVLREFRAVAPRVQLELHEGGPPDLLRALRERRIDVVFTVLDVVGEDVHVQHLWDEPLVAALPAGHCLADRDAISWGDLADEPLVVRTWESGSTLYNFLSARIAPDRYVPADEHFVSREALLGLVGIGFGITVMGASAAQATFPDVVFRPLAGEATSVAVNAVWLKDNDNPARGRFVAMLRDWRSDRQPTTTVPRRSRSGRGRRVPAFGAVQSHGPSP